jgi:hypothetical protein
MARTHDGKAFRLLTIIDAYPRECLAIEVSRRLDAAAVLYRWTDLFVSRRPPDYIRSDNGPEFTATAVREWLSRVGVKTLSIELGSPGENGYHESFNGKLGDELLNGEIFYTLKEAQILIERWRREYNTLRPHRALGYRPPAPEAIQVMPRDPGSAMLRQDLWLDLTPHPNLKLGTTTGGRPGLEKLLDKKYKVNIDNNHRLRMLPSLCKISGEKGGWTGAHGSAGTKFNISHLQPRFAQPGLFSW